MEIVSLLSVTPQIRVTCSPPFLKRPKVFDDTEPKSVVLEKITDIYKHSDRVKAALKAKLE